MAVLMISISYYFFYILTLNIKFVGNFRNEYTFEILCGYGFGCTLSALFCRISGGIFTKGADISCDFVGKLEEKLCENDVKNPCSIADNVGDIIGDLVGSILDLVASIAETFCIVTLIISYMQDQESVNFDFILLFFTIFSTSLLIFIIVEKSVNFSESTQSEKEIEEYLFKLIRLTTIGMIISVIIIVVLISPDNINFSNHLISKYVIMITILLGLISGYLICYSTYFYTGRNSKSISQLTIYTCQMPALNVIYGLSIGFLSTVAPMIIIAVTVLISSLFCGIYGIAFASFGFLLNLPVILLYQMFGPIADVSLGILHIVDYDPATILRVNQLDITGNTMSAVVKGFASGNAGLISFGIFGAIMLSANVQVLNLYEISHLMFLLFGGAFAYLIQSLCMFATVDNASLLVSYSKFIYYR